MTGNLQNASGLAQTIPLLRNLGSMGVLEAQQLLHSIPGQNIGMAANLTVPIAGLGGQIQGSNVGTSNTQTTKTPSLLDQIQSGIKIGTGLFGQGLSGGLFR